ncbi:hypothetical protein MY1884_004158 [Beauveria asiatica]
MSDLKFDQEAALNRDQPSQLDALKECIAVGEAAGWDKALLDT